MKIPLVTFVFLVASVALAQQSASYEITEYAFNAAGHPAGGVTPTSASYRIAISSIGEPMAAFAASSPSFGIEGGLIAGYPPPGEVYGLRFDGPAMLAWNPERSAGDYNLYRDTVGSLLGMGYGSCEQYDIGSTSATDTDPVPPGDGFFYLVTVKNRLGEEGTKGLDSSGAPRPNPNPCP